MEPLCRGSYGVYVAVMGSARRIHAVVTPLRKAASYEQRKTNLGSSP